MPLTGQSPTVPPKGNVTAIPETLKPFWLPPDDEHFLLQNAVESRARRERPAVQQGRRKKPSDEAAPRRLGAKRGAAPAGGAHPLRPAEFCTMQRAAMKHRTTLRRYISEVRDVLRMRLCAAQGRDERLRLQACMQAERARLTVAGETIQNHVEELQAFLEHDCSETQELRKMAEEQTQLESSLEQEYVDLRAQLAASERRVYLLAEKWLKAKVYQNFLIQVSPMWWRKQYDPALQESEQKEAAVVESLEKSLQRYQPQPATLDAMLAVFQEDMRGREDEDTEEVQAVPLFFKDPEELMSVFDAMERHILNSLLLTEELWAPLEAMRHDLNQTITEQQQQLAYVNDHISDLERSVAWETARARDLEARTRHLLRGRFSRLLVSDDALCLYVCVEDAYEACVGPNDDKLGLLDMMTAVENKYWSLLRELDALPASIVAHSRRIVHIEERRRMRRAHTAEQIVQRLRRGEHRLLHDFLVFHAEYCPYSDQPSDFLQDKKLLSASSASVSPQVSD
ncbi:cilia- and flagella-associated protein 100-like [Schistocerca cancellata]|uniref:cilia- and flagella-associated protein 100-like n=1 Tax=Schistocerca cancellata TaxID=274614 RepID=UPI0021175FDC|nr:cilia- and flagella-associated protein 100-like [Schistocerca cancellata]